MYRLYHSFFFFFFNMWVANRLVVEGNDTQAPGDAEKHTGQMEAMR